MSATKSSIVVSQKDAAYAAKVNEQLKMTCPELGSVYAQYPLDRDRWLGFDETIDGELVFVASTQDNGLKKNYVYCTVGQKGKGYYHLLNKTSYVNLYNREGNSPPGSCCAGASPEEMAAWETTKMYLYNRSRAPRPDDVAGAKASIDHMEGSKLNPVYGITG